MGLASRLAAWQALGNPKKLARPCVTKHSIDCSAEKYGDGRRGRGLSAPPSPLVGGCTGCSTSSWTMQSLVIFNLPSYLMKTHPDNPGGQHGASTTDLVYPTGGLLWVSWQRPAGLGMLNTCSMRQLACEHQPGQFASHHYIRTQSGHAAHTTVDLVFSSRLLVRQLDDQVVRGRHSCPSSSCGA
jgi:hypothetical protein